MAIMTQHMRDQIAAHMAECEWAERDEKTGQLYIKFDEIRVSSTSVEYFFKGEEVTSMREIFDSGKGETLTILGIEGRMKVGISA